MNLNISGKLNTEKTSKRAKFFQPQISAFRDLWFQPSKYRTSSIVESPLQLAYIEDSLYSRKIDNGPIEVCLKIAPTLRCHEKSCMEGCLYNVGTSSYHPFKNVYIMQVNSMVSISDSTLIHHKVSFSYQGM